MFLQWPIYGFEEGLATQYSAVSSFSLFLGFLQRVLLPEVLSQALPAPDPAASRGNRRRCLLRSTLPRALAVDLPISTLGPSGPSEQPLPRVMAAAVARSTGARAALSCLLAPLPYAPDQEIAQSI